MEVQKPIEANKHNQKKLDEIAKFVGQISDASNRLWHAELAVESAETEETAQQERRKVSQQKESRRLARVHYDRLIYPLGVTSDSAFLSAPTLKLSINPEKPINERQLEVVQLDPITYEPLTNDQTYLLEKNSQSLP